MGVRRTLGPDSRDIWQHRDQQAGEVARRDVLEHHQLAYSRAGVHLPSWNQKRPGKATTLWFIKFIEIAHSLSMQLQSLDRFISLISIFEGDSPIPAVLISARTTSFESAEDSLKGHSARSSRTWAPKGHEQKSVRDQDQWPRTQSVIYPDSSKTHPGVGPCKISTQTHPWRTPSLVVRPLGLKSL
jgi:hypothetical protein